MIQGCHGLGVEGCQCVGIAAMLTLLARRGYFDPADLRHVPSLRDVTPLLWVGAPGPAVSSRVVQGC